MRKISTFLLVLTLVCNLLLISPAPCAAADGGEIGWWVGAGACSLLYTPIKAVFFLLMGIAGGLSAMVTVPLDKVDISSQIVKWGFYGDWLIRPDHLHGEALPQFIGFNDEIRFVFLQPDPETGRILHANIPSSPLQ